MAASTPVCATSLLGSDIPWFGDENPLHTPNLMLELGVPDVGTHFGSPCHIASPTLAGWTPQLSTKDFQMEIYRSSSPSLMPIERRPLAAGPAGVEPLAQALALPPHPAAAAAAAATVTPADLPIAPLAALSLPDILQSSFMMPFPNNLMQQDLKEEEGCHQGLPPAPHAACTSSSMVPTCALPARMETPSHPAFMHMVPDVMHPAVPLSDPATGSSTAVAATCAATNTNTGSSHSGGSGSSCGMAAPMAATAVTVAAVVASVEVKPDPEPALSFEPRSQQQEQQQSQQHQHQGSSSGGGASSGSAACGRGCSLGAVSQEQAEPRLTLEFLEENGYFDMPIQQAASELSVGVTTLKKVCRVNNIGRWPFRKRSSLNRLIEKTREYFAADPEQCAEALAQLEAQRSVLRAQQGEDIPDALKRYRQSIFKLDYKVKKIAKERRTHKGAAAAQLAAMDKAHTIRQLGVGTPANSILGILCDAEQEQQERHGSGGVGSGDGAVQQDHQEHQLEEQEEQEEQQELQPCIPMAVDA